MDADWLFWKEVGGFLVMFTVFVIIVILGVTLEQERE